MSSGERAVKTDKQIIQELREPFPADVVSWRIGASNKEKTSGIALAYIDARDVMQRLDKVMGLEWQCRYPFEGCCEIGLKINGEWMWRSNGAGQTDIEGEKGQYSDAFKRAAVMWGIGQYLYYLANVWVPLENGGKKLSFNPELPSWALPKPKVQQ